jgi:hypothetical protein
MIARVGRAGRTAAISSKKPDHESRGSAAAASYDATDEELRELGVDSGSSAFRVRVRRLPRTAGAPRRDGCGVAPNDVLEPALLRACDWSVVLASVARRLQSGSERIVTEGNNSVWVIPTHYIDNVGGNRYFSPAPLGSLVGAERVVSVVAKMVGRVPYRHCETAIGGISSVVSIDCCVSAVLFRRDNHWENGVPLLWTSRDSLPR